MAVYFHDKKNYQLALLDVPTDYVLARLTLLFKKNSLCMVMKFAEHTAKSQSLVFTSLSVYTRLVFQNTLKLKPVLFQVLHPLT